MNTLVKEKISGTIFLIKIFRIFVKKTTGIGVATWVRIVKFLFRKSINYKLW